MNKLGLGLAALGLATVTAGGITAHALGDDPSADPTAVDTRQVSDTGARTELGDLDNPSRDPVPDGLQTANPSPGSVEPLTGPFDDRFAWRRLQVTAGTVSGAVQVTSDVSDLLELQVVTGFYDARGRYLGIARFTHHLGEGAHAHTGPPSEVEPFTVRAPAAVRDRAVSAAVAVPVLVNE